jgi:hypothetical protein
MIVMAPTNPTPTLAALKRRLVVGTHLLQTMQGGNPIEPRRLVVVKVQTNGLWFTAATPATPATVADGPAHARGFSAWPAAAAHVVIVGDTYTKLEPDRRLGGRLVPVARYTILPPADAAADAATAATPPAVAVASDLGQREVDRQLDAISDLTVGFGLLPPDALAALPDDWRERTLGFLRDHPLLTAASISWALTSLGYLPPTTTAAPTPAASDSTQAPVTPDVAS